MTEPQADAPRTPSSPPEAPEVRETPLPTPGTSPESGWLTTRRALIAQVLAVLVTPLTVAVTLYLTDVFKRPSPRLEYVSAQIRYIPLEPPSSLADSIAQRSRLSLMYRDELSRMSDSAGNSLLRCTSWLNRGAWNSDCLDPYITVTAKIENLIETTIQDVKSRGRSAPPTLAALFPNVKDAEAELAIVKTVAAGLGMVADAELPRSGNVEISVGVMNTGDSDGTIFRDATVAFGKHTVHAYSDEYVPVKAHDFREATFVTPWFDGKDFHGEVRRGDEDAIKLLTQEIRAGKAVPFTIAVTLSDRTKQISSTIEP